MSMRVAHRTILTTATRVALSILTLAAGCATSPARQSSSPPKSERNVLTRQEIFQASYDAFDLFRAIRGLRPQFLAPPGVRSRAVGSWPIVVYVDRMRQSGLDALRTLRAADVDEVRYLDPTEAQSELGAAGSGGALMVKLHKP